MEKIKIPEFRTIVEYSPKSFDKSLNSAIRELAEYDPEIIFVDKFCARLKYFPHEKEVPETVRDEFHLEGVYYHCRNCPHLEDPQDRRVKWCKCKYTKTGKTHKNNEACELFYKWVAQNAVEVIEDSELILW